MSYNYSSIVGIGIGIVSLGFSIFQYFDNKSETKRLQEELKDELEKMDENTKDDLRHVAVEKYIDKKPEMVVAFIKKNKKDQ